MSLALASCERIPTWRNFPVLCLQFELEMLESFRLPPFAGSLFRGVLGWALKEGCDSSTYEYLFETSSDKDGQADAVRPFLLIPPLQQRRLEAGDRFRLSLYLLGSGCDHLPAFLEAIERAGTYGLGREHSQFRILKMTVQEGRRSWVCYERNLGWPRAYLPMPSSLQSFVSELPEGQVEEIDIEFQTPTRLVHLGRPVRQPEFHVVLRALYRRLDALLQHHASQSLEVDYRGDIAAAQKVEIVEGDCRWFDWQRTSSRQGRHQMGGFVGRVRYRGPFDKAWLELLQTASVLHLGKATTFGMGSLCSRVVSLRSTLPSPPTLLRKSLREETPAACLS